MTPNPPPLSLADRVDRACDAFESAWSDGQSPRIESFLVEANDQERAVLLRELLAIELELRIAAGQGPTVVEYRARFPADVDTIDSAFAAAETPKHATTAADSGETVYKPPVEPNVPGYEILGELGRGGMGVVYRARHIVLNRPCALKMIRSGRLAGSRETGRFLLEAEAAARLRHPNVVQVYGLGEWEGLPYIEMEYVDGGTLAARLDGTPLPPREAATLMTTLARAIEEAHRLGVVHRDLKPANVLIAADGTPKVADFGLAKAIGRPDGLDFTRTDEVIGTPSYMAPEQADGRAKDAGPATDVYALGAILYEMLTGRPPFKGTSIAETLEQVREVEPVSPSRLAPTLSTDLETICLKCLQKDPAARYLSAAALAEDLDRYLDGRPILARPIGPARRLWRWCRRHKTVAALTATLLILLVASSVGAGLAAYRFRQSALREQRLAAQAEKNLDQAVQVVDEMYTQVADKLGDRPQMDVFQREVFLKALRFYEQFALRQSAKPDVKAATALAGVRVGLIQARFGRLKEAQAAYDRSMPIFESLVAQHPAEPRYRQGLAYNLHSLGMLNLATGRVVDAERNFRRALSESKALGDISPDNINHRRNLASCLSELGIIHSYAGRLTEAIDATRDAVRIESQVIERRPDLLASRLSRARDRTNLCVYLRQVGRLPESEEEGIKAVRELKPFVADHPEDADLRDVLSIVWINLGLSQYARGEHLERAEKSLSSALALKETLAKEHREVVRYQEEVAAGLLNLGVVRMEMGRVEEAGAAYRRSIEIREALAKADPEAIDIQVNLASSRNNLYEVYLKTGRADDATAVLARAFTDMDRLAIRYPDRADIAILLGQISANAGDHLLSLSKRAEALDRWTRGVEVLDRLHRRSPADVNAKAMLGLILDRRAQLALREGRLADARADWDRALPFLEGSPPALRARLNRAIALARLHEPSLADAEVAAVVAAFDAPTPAPNDFRSPTDVFYDAACVYAIASADAAIPDRDRLASTAVGLIDRCRKAGYFLAAENRKLIEEDSDLAPLRDRDDFRRLRDDILKASASPSAGAAITPKPADRP